MERSLNCFTKTVQALPKGSKPIKNNNNIIIIIIIIIIVIIIIIIWRRSLLQNELTSPSAQTESLLEA